MLTELSFLEAVEPASAPQRPGRGGEVLAWLAAGLGVWALCERAADAAMDGG